MIRSLMRVALCVVLAGSWAAGPAHAQLEENLTSLTGDQTQGYLGPLATGLSAALNSGIFKSGDPAVRARAIVEATTFYNDPAKIGKISRNLGEAMVGINIGDIPETELLAVRGW